MSRIEDADRDAQRAVARKDDRKKEEQQAANRRAQRTAFAKLVARDPSATEARPSRPTTDPERPGRQPGLGREPSAVRCPDSPDSVDDSRRRDRRIGERAAEAPGAEPGAATVEPTGGALETAERDAGSDSSQGDQKQGSASPGFRFNPALMAPVPVAKPKGTASSERLRALATEIAQQIVERVRVGTDRSGRAEFQIDLRSEVLAGLSIRISAGDGKIQASFSSSDRAVAALLRKNADGLKMALGRRGLRLEELLIEERS